MQVPTESRCYPTGIAPQSGDVLGIYCDKCDHTNVIHRREDGQCAACRTEAMTDEFIADAARELRDAWNALLASAEKRQGNVLN